MRNEDHELHAHLSLLQVEVPRHITFQGDVKWGGWEHHAKWKGDKDVGMHLRKDAVAL